MKQRSVFLCQNIFTYKHFKNLKMKNSNTPDLNLTEAKETVKKLKYLHKRVNSADNVAEDLATNSEKFYETFEELILSVNKIDTNPELEKLFAAEQLLIIEKNWAGAEYSERYMGGANRIFFKAQNQAELNECSDLLAKVKSWTEGSYTHSFWAMFFENTKNMSKKMSGTEFHALQIPANTVAKIYGTIHIWDIAKTVWVAVFNATRDSRRLPSFNFEEFQSRLNSIGDKLNYGGFAENALCEIFDRLVLEHGYNPIKLRG